MRGIDRRALVLGVGLAGIATRASAAAVPKVDQPAPPFDVFTYDWRKIHFADMAGKVTILHFWAGWCASCQRELPRLDAYYRGHRDAPLQIFPVRVQDNVEPAVFEGYAQQFAMPFVWHLDGSSYGPINGAVPTSFVIDTAGVLRYARAGAFTDQGLEQVVTPLLSRSAPVTAAPTLTPLVRDDDGVEARPPPVVTQSQNRIGTPPKGF